MVSDLDKPFESCHISSQTEEVLQLPYLPPSILPPSSNALQKTFSGGWFGIIIPLAQWNQMLFWNFEIAVVSFVF